MPGVMTNNISFLKMTIVVQDITEHKEDADNRPIRVTITLSPKTAVNITVVERERPGHDIMRSCLY